MSDDLDALRKRLIVVPFERCPGCGLNRGRSQHPRIICEHAWHDVEAAFAQGVDAVLAALEQVGWKQHGTLRPPSRLCARLDCADEAEAIYRITPDLCAAHADKEEPTDG